MDKKEAQEGWRCPYVPLPQGVRGQESQSGTLSASAGRPPCGPHWSRGHCPWLEDLVYPTKLVLRLSDTTRSWISEESCKAGWRVDPWRKKPSVALKNVIGVARVSQRIIGIIAQTEENKGGADKLKMVWKYRQMVQTETELLFLWCSGGTGQTPPSSSQHWWVQDFLG